MPAPGVPRSASMATSFPASTSARTLVIDPTHSEATFQVRHLITKVRGSFGEFAGTIQFEEAHPEHSSVTFTIQTASIDTNQADRDTHLRSEDFFHAEKFPMITFKSTSVKAYGKDHWPVASAPLVLFVGQGNVLLEPLAGLAKGIRGKERAGFE